MYLLKHVRLERLKNSLYSSYFIIRDFHVRLLIGRTDLVRLFPFWNPLVS